jgi:hypothetical protein
MTTSWQRALIYSYLPFDRVLSAYQRSEDPEAAQRADDIVRRMEELYETGEIDAPPDTYHYTILCGTWARSGNKYSVDRVLQILVHMVERGSASLVFAPKCCVLVPSISCR